MNTLLTPFFTWEFVIEEHDFAEYVNVTLRVKIGPFEAGTKFGSLEVGSDGYFRLAKDMDEPLGSKDSYEGRFKFVLE